MKRFLLHSFLLFIVPLTTHAQEVWTLQQCLETGLKNNLDFQVKQLDVLSAKTTHRNAALEYLPLVNVTGSHSYSIGSTIDPATNSRVSSNIQSDNFALNASMNIVDFNIFTTARRNKIAVLKANADKEAAATEYSLTILENYYNILYTQELLKIQQSQFENAIFNLKRIEKEVEIGSRPKSDLYDMQVVYAQENNGITTTQQLLYNQKLTLIQLMNRPDILPDNILVENSSLQENVTKPETEVFENALKNYPKILSAQLNQDISKKNIKIQKNYYLPVVQAYYNYSSFYYLPLKQMGGQQVNPFWTQITDNKNHYIGLQLNVPVFNGLRTHRDVQLAKIEYQKSVVMAEQEKINLRQTIEQETAKQQQNTTLAVKLEDTRNYAQKSFETTQAKFSSGLIEAIVFTGSKNQLLTAEYNLLKARVTLSYLALKLNYLQYNRFF